MSVKSTVTCNRCGTKGQITTHRYSMFSQPSWGGLDLNIERSTADSDDEVELYFDLCPACARAAMVFLKIFMAEPGNPDLIELDLDELP